MGGPTYSPGDSAADLQGYPDYMAFLQPKNIPSRNDLPARLQSVAKALREFLPDEVTVWLERTGQGDTAALQRQFEDLPRADGEGDDSEAYLVMLDPEAGVAVLEAPLLTRGRWGRRKKIDPSRVRTSIAERTLALRDGLDHRSIQALPVVHALALPRTPRQDIRRKNSDLPVLTEEDFTREALRPAIHRIIGGRDLPLTEEDETGARATVNPEIIIGGAEGGPMFPPPDRDSERLIRILDRMQEQLARHLGPGYRLIRGVAGSGKTLILTHRAKYIAHHFPQWRILLLCFNRALSLALAQEMRDAGNVDVSTVDSLAYRMLPAEKRNTGRNYRKRPDFDRRRREALEVARALEASERFDMVLVDEAQDLDTTGLDLAWAMLKPGRDHFVMALDSAQNVYRRRMTWNPPEITARGRSTVLRINYRNTREILGLALEILLGLDRESPEDRRPDDLDVLVMPEEGARIGDVPVTFECADFKTEARAIAAKVEELLGAGAAADNIVVLSGSRNVREEVLHLIPNAFDATKSRDRGVSGEGKVRVATLQLLKGLEFRHVIVGGANDIWVREKDDDAPDEQRKRLMYVAMTRATETLTITYSGEGPVSTLFQTARRN